MKGNKITKQSKIFDDIINNKAKIKLKEPNKVNIKK